MKYKPEHKTEVHEKLLNTASKQIRSRGLNQVTVKSVMEAEGMTVGGFYSHFSSKEDLLLKAVVKAFEDTWSEFYGPLEAYDDTHWMRQMTACYMNPTHIQQRESMCPIAGLMSEVARSNDVIKHAFQEHLKITLNKIQKRTGAIKATGVMALFTGGIQMAAACDDPGFQQALLKDAIKCATVLMQADIE